MTFKGTVLKYDSASESGVIMLSNGKQKKFTSQDWIDTLTKPMVHQKVSFENDESPMQIKSIAQENTSQPTPKKEKTTQKKFTDIDECIQYFTNKKFKIIRDNQEGESRSLILRSYSQGDFAEVIIKSTTSRIKVTQTVNGKPLL